MSTVYPNGKVWYIGFTDQFGRRRELSTKIKIEKLTKNGKGKYIVPETVRAVQRKIELDVAANVFGLKTLQRRPITLNELHELYDATEGSSSKPSTRRSKQIAINSLRSVTGNAYLYEITEAILYSWIKKCREKKLSEHSIACYIRTLSPVFNWAVRNGYMERNPVVKGVRLHPPVPAPVIFSEQELDEVFELAKSEHGQHYYHQLVFLSLTGFRISEACNLKWSQVDFKGGIIKVHNEKENRNEPFPLDDALETFLRQLPKENEFVLHYRDRANFDKWLKKIIRKLKLNDELSVHCIRKTFGSRLVQKGVDFAITHKLMRHRNPATTMKYYIWFNVDTLRKGLAQSR
jgi:integrase